MIRKSLEHPEVKAPAIGHTAEAAEALITSFWTLPIWKLYKTLRMFLWVVRSLRSDRIPIVSPSSRYNPLEGL